MDKITRGPELPFTRFRIPPLRNIQRGNIVTFRNPRYEKAVESELKHLFSQFLYMITFTGINIDKYDDFGDTKADPLVKRVVALPGEQVQIINDRIYIRNNLNEEFKLQEDNIHSETDLYRLNPNTVEKLVQHKIDKGIREILNQIDQKIENLNRDQIIEKNYESFNKAQAIRTRLLTENPDLIKNGLEKQYENISRSKISVDKYYSPFQKIEYLRDDNIHYLYNMNDDKIWNQGWSFLLSVNPENEVHDFNSITTNTDLMYNRWLAIGSL